MSDALDWLIALSLGAAAMRSNRSDGVIPMSDAPEVDAIERGARFTPEAHKAWVDLVAEVRRLRAENAELTKQFQDLMLVTADKLRRGDTDE